jgi:alpha-tubulin suppressor-like RCC1 family protein
VSTEVAFVALSLGTSHTCALTGDGQAYCWGNGEEGALGTGDTADRSVPTPVATDLRFSVVSAGGSHTCGVTLTGEAYCWGANDQGQLGVGGSGAGEVTTPAAVAGGMTFRDIAAGGEHTCAATVDGRALCWGANDEGQLGNGTTEQQNTPGEVAG